MSFQEIITFLLPTADPLQLIFAVLIGGLSLVTVIALRRGARASSWERKWNGGGQDDLDVEHGSLHEISEAVASPGEKMAEFMPGILLILGLLGTFLGLGIALNKASTILVEANAGGGMGDAMTNLMGMMEGLGTKFKTSTWGILAFLLLKAYAAINGYEERRMRWCVGQMKRAFDSSREQRQGERQQAQHALLETLNRLDQNLASQHDSKRQLLDLQARLSKHHTATTQQALIDSRASIDALLTPLQSCVQEQQALNQTLQTLLQAQQSGNQSLQKLVNEQLAGNQTLQAMEQQQQTSQTTLAALSDDTQAGNQVLRDALQEQKALNKTLSSVPPALRELLGAGEQSQASLTAINNQLQHHAEQNQQQLEDGRATRQAMEQLIESNSSNLAAISGAAEQMAGAAGTIGASAGDLQQAIGEFKEGVASVLGHLKQDLGETIGLMGNSFRENMTQMSSSLARATDGISTAVTDLSNNVGQTMEGMKKSNEASLDLQRNAHASFQGSSETLQVNVQGMTHLVEDLREKILSGLKAVSDSGRRMVELDKRYNTITTEAEATANNIKALVAQLEAMRVSSPLQPAVDALAARVEMIGRNLQGIDKRLEALGNLAQHNTQHSTGADIAQSLRQIIERLHTLERFAQPQALAESVG